MMESKSYEELSFRLKEQAGKILTVLTSISDLWRLTLATPPLDSLVEYWTGEYSIMRVTWTLRFKINDERYNVQLQIDPRELFSQRWFQYRQYLYMQVIQNYSETVFHVNMDAIWKDDER